MKKANKKEEFRRKEILKATYDLCVENPIVKVTMREIAKLSEYPLSTIYKHYRSKEELIYDLCITLIEFKASYFKYILKKENTGLKRLLMYLLCNLQFLCKFPTELNLLSFLLSMNDESTEIINPEFILLQKPRDEEIGRFIHGIYKLGIKDGSFREDLNIGRYHEMSNYSFRYAIFRVVYWENETESYYWEMVQIFLNSIVKPEKIEEMKAFVLNEKPYIALPDEIDFNQKADLDIDLSE